MFAPRRRPKPGNAKGGSFGSNARGNDNKNKTTPRPPRQGQGQRRDGQQGPGGQQGQTRETGDNRFRNRNRPGFSGPPRHSKPTGGFSGPRRPQPPASTPPPRSPSAAPSRSTSGEPIRLQKILAQAGLGSRRACEELILQGRVTVDGATVRELGFKVDPAKSKVTVDGQKVSEEKLVYFAVNKPKGYLSTNEDPAGRPRVVDLLPEIPQRVYTIGRLDEASVGLILVTNDGDLANQLAHPKFGVEKLYRVTLAGLPGPEIVTQLTEGIWLSDGKVRAKRARIIARRGQSTIMDVVLAEGKNREIRRMLAKFGHKVMSLTRMAIGPITVKGLPGAGVRPLTRQEVSILQKIGQGKASGAVPGFKPFDSRSNFKRNEGQASPQGQGQRREPGPRSNVDRGERAFQPRPGQPARPGQPPRRPDFRGDRNERGEGDFRGQPRFPRERSQGGPGGGPRHSQGQGHGPGPKPFRPHDRNRDQRDGDRPMRFAPQGRERDDRGPAGEGQDRRPSRPFARPGMGGQGPQNRGPRPFSKPGMGQGDQDRGPRPFAKPGMGQGPPDRGPRPFSKPPGARPMPSNRSDGPIPSGPKTGGPPPSGPSPRSGGPISSGGGSKNSGPPPSGPNSNRPRPILGPPRGNDHDGSPRSRPVLGPPRSNAPADRPRPFSGGPRPADRNQGPRPFRPNSNFKPRPKFGPPADGAPPARKIIGLEPQEREAFDLAGLPASERRKRLQMRMQATDMSSGPKPRPRPGMGKPKFGGKPARGLSRPQFKPDRTGGKPRPNGNESDPS